jgi:hypothetical protein
MTGHQTVKQFLNYINATDDDLINELMKYDRFKKNASTKARHLKIAK